MQYPCVFLKTRTIALGSLSLASLLWAILLSVVLFSQWDVLDVAERSFIVVMLVIHTITIVMLLILLIVIFRPWLDAARIMFLLMAHIGAAGTFAYWYPRFTCLSQDPNQEGVCKLIIAYILIISWLVPILLVIYGAGLGLMVWWHRMSTTQTVVVADEESDIERRLSTPDMKQRTPSTFTFPRHFSSSERFSNVSAGSRYSEPNPSRKSSHSEDGLRVAARLSKPPPVFHF
ncbi:hypothetical protein LshimejAT787_0206250 [Lyophyllum shimeji]|uniref:Uncharacterized protein n=1 Tax=Lyophyllum shimeji TaxID=47721 RepID=A0A9P3PFJ0_LYOSH|nr:hypothetical protein LshimejAT787_0206250 [Lyophyllum shimeji]